MNYLLMKQNWLFGAQKYGLSCIGVLCCECGHFKCLRSDSESKETEARWIAKRKKTFTNQNQCIQLAFRSSQNTFSNLFGKSTLTNSPPFPLFSSTDNRYVHCPKQIKAKVVHMLDYLLRTVFSKTCLKIHSFPQSIHRKVVWDLFWPDYTTLLSHTQSVIFLSAHILEHEWKGELNSTRIDMGVILYVTHSHTYTSTFLFTLFHLFRIALYKFCLSWISNDECNLPFLLPNPN